MNTSLTQEIPRAGWQPFFEHFAKQHAGWAVTAELLATDVGDQRVIDGLPLQGISYEAKGGSQAGDLLIEAGDVGTIFTIHLIHRPTSIYLVITRPGQETDFKADTEDGFTTLFRVRRRLELPSPGTA